MGAAKGRDPLTGAGQQVATGRAGSGTETLVILSLAQNASAKKCAGYFLHDLDAPCYDYSSRRLCALAAFYVDDLLRDIGEIVRDNEPKASIIFDVLVAILRSSLRMRRSTAVRVIRALVKAGLLVAEDPEGVTSWQE